MIIYTHNYTLHICELLEQRMQILPTSGWCKSSRCRYMACMSPKQGNSSSSRHVVITLQRLPCAAQHPATTTWSYQTQPRHPTRNTTFLSWWYAGQSKVLLIIWRYWSRNTQTSDVSPLCCSKASFKYTQSCTSSDIFGDTDGAWSITASRKVVFLLHPGRPSSATALDVNLMSWAGLSISQHFVHTMAT